MHQRLEVRRLQVKRHYQRRADLRYSDRQRLRNARSILHASASQVWFRCRRIDLLRSIQIQLYCPIGRMNFEALCVILKEWEIRYCEHYKTEYDAFILLWNKLDLLPLSFELDLERLKIIEMMY